MTPTLLVKIPSVASSVPVKSVTPWLTVPPTPHQATVPISMNVPEPILVLQLRLVVTLSDRTPVHVKPVIPVMEELVLT